MPRGQKIVKRVCEVRNWRLDCYNELVSNYAAGFHDSTETAPIELEWCGTPPDWLQGSLLRNGPGRFNRGRVEVSHWFDGLALLHAFRLRPDGVSYRSRFVRSHDYRVSEQDGEIASPGFACDPCRSLFRKMASAFIVDATDNPNVNLVKQGNEFLALTELPIPMVIDPQTLRSKGALEYNDELPHGSTTAHPHQDGRLLINHVLHYSARPSYRFYSQDSLGPRKEFARVPVGDVSYVHSFGMSEDYLILTCCPFQVAPIKLLTRSRPFIENFQWKPRFGTRFHLLPRPGRPGRARKLLGEPFFAFHHINSFQKGSHLYIDISCYPTARVIQQLKLAELRKNKAIDFGMLRRYRVDLQTDELVRLWEFEHPVELARIHYSRHNGKEYRYVHGVSADPEESVFYDRLIKVDLNERQSEVWKESNTYPGEPVFVPRPNSREEDDGVVLSVILNGETACSFLLVLDARSMTELARAWVPAAIPHGFHGLFQAEEAL